MEYRLPDYLSLRYEGEDEQKYIAGLIEQLDNAMAMESYHLALFAYHLLFICFFYQTFYKLKLWMPDKYHMALVSFSADRRTKFREATSPTAYAHKDNHERSFFEFLNVFCDCEDLVARCKKLVDYRNERLGHVNYLLVDSDAFELRIVQYDEIIAAIQRLTHDELHVVFADYVAQIDPSLEITKDDIETDLIVPHKLSTRDLRYLLAECHASPNERKSKIAQILNAEFGVEVATEEVESSTVLSS